ncbi:MAG: DNA polymerase III subunit chi [Alphaproteobacteria bacterium]
MTTEIRFYHMEKQKLEDVLPALLLKALENGRRILVKTLDEKEAERLCEHLWTYQPDIFLPHGTQKDGNAEKQPVFLTANNENPNNADMIILTQGMACDDLSPFSLCCEILDGRDETQIAAARNRWKKYKEAGHALTYWQQGEKSWEKKNTA